MRLQDEVFGDGDGGGDGNGTRLFFSIVDLHAYTLRQDPVVSFTFASSCFFVLELLRGLS